MFVPVTFMFSRPLASHFLRRSLLASSRTFAPARHLPKYVRLNSSSTDSPASGGKPGAVGSGKVSLDAWAPPILTYEQVKPKTEQPSPVCRSLSLSLSLHFWARDADHRLGFVFDRRPGTGRGHSGLDPLFGQHPALCAPRFVVHESG